MLRKIASLKKLISNTLVDNGLFSKKATGHTPLILMYHGVDRTQRTTFNERFFSVANFEKQIATFKKHCHILTYTEFAEGNFAPGKPNVLLTFDDGYANNFNYALPILDKYNAHALFFITGVDTLERKVLWADALDIVSSRAAQGYKVVVENLEFRFNGAEFMCAETGTSLAAYIRASRESGYAEKGSIVNQLIDIYDFTKDESLDDYWRLMTREQIRKTSESKNITIGSHGFYHNNLGSLPHSDAMDEVLLSKKYLEGIIQKEVSSIGFPDGSYTEKLNGALNDVGIKEQFVVSYRYGDENKRTDTHNRYGLYPGMGNDSRLLYKILHHKASAATL